jgi:tRNA1(Val) A37 N6-methylase TrmN6
VLRSKHPFAFVGAKQKSQKGLKMIFEPLLPGIDIALSKKHRFTTDAVLLARFASPHKGERVCDLCCGVGIVPLLWFGAGETPPHYVTGLDIDAEAIKLFNTSIKRNGLEDRVLALQGDVRNPPFTHKDKPFDCVTCNPPYHKKQPQGDPARSEMLCETEDIIKAAARLLRFGGRLCLCHRPARLPEVLACMQAFGIPPKRMRLVSYKIGAKPRLVLIEGRYGAKPGLDVLPSFVLTGHDGTMTEETAEIYRMR